MIDYTVAAGQAALIAFLLASVAYQLTLLTTTAIGIIRHRRTVWGEQSERLLASEWTPSITVIAPAHNEAVTVVASLRALLTLSYPSLEIVVVNDGSTDSTLATMLAEFDLRPVHLSQPGSISTQPVRGLYRSGRHGGLVVLDKVNGGKADALNAGLNVATGDLVCAVDVDTLIEPDALLRIVRPFLTDDATLAAGATIRVVNGSEVRAGRVISARAPRGLLAGVQTVEYLRSFLVGRLGWNHLGGNLIVSGAFGLFRRDAMLAVGGYRADTVGEDIELVVRMRRHGIETGGRTAVTFVADPIAWTEAPSSLRVLGRQRDRWQRGLADTLHRHRRLGLNPRYRTLGLLAYPYYFGIELLGPVLEAVGVATLMLAALAGSPDLARTGLLLVILYVWGVAVSIATLLVYQWSSGDPYPARDLPRLVAFAVVEYLGYHQLTVMWRLRGMARFLRGDREWGHMVRAGFDPAVPAAAR